MSNLRDIKRRIKSVRNTSKITKAMQMVASAKMRRAQEMALKSRSYISALANVFKHLKDCIEESNSPLMELRETGKSLIIIVNTDRGLCGGLNSNLIREVLKNAPADADYITIGAKLNNPLTRADRNLLATFSLSDTINERDMKPIFDFIRKSYIEGGYKEVDVYYQKFINVMVQRPMHHQLLPITSEELILVAAQDELEDTDNENFILEPSANALLGSILPLYFFNFLFEMVLEGKACEQSARMVAMKAATENAKDLIDTLTLDFNKARQTQITNELLEITTAMRAME